MSAIRVAVVNKRGRDHNEEVRDATAALRRQLREDFCPVWAVDADIEFFEAQNDDSGQFVCEVPRGWWWLVIGEQSTDPKVFGRHALSKEGLPTAVVYADTSGANGPGWTVTASHELLEMLVNPWDNRTAFDPGNGQPSFYSLEVCDPCQASRYEIGVVSVSSFVYPAFFVPPSMPTWRGPLARCGEVTEPLLPAGVDGSIGVYRISSGTGWERKSSDGKCYPVGQGQDPLKAWADELDTNGIGVGHQDSTK
jgi:hypothetical protein